MKPTRKWVKCPICKQEMTALQALRCMYYSVAKGYILPKSEILITQESVAIPL